jgi:hypothetical protein
MSKEDAWRIKTGLRLLAKYFKEAELARRFFDRVPPPSLPRIAKRRRRIDHTALAELSIKWRQYERACLEKSMYAREFIFALDNFLKQLRVMAKDPSASPALKTAVENFTACVPGIVDVRNSLHHQEDRNRGQSKPDHSIARSSRTPKQLEWEGWDFSSQQLSLPLLVDMKFDGSKVAFTVEDGRAIEIDIGESTAEEMIRTLQRVIDAFPWRRGFPQVYASFYEMGELST